MLWRVVITGLGSVTPLGHTVNSTWSALLQNQTGIRKLINDPILKNTKPIPLSLIKQFPYKKWTAAHANSRQNSFVLAAAHEAIQNSKINLQNVQKDRIGIVLGVIGSNNTKISQFVQQSYSQNFTNINRLSLLHLITSIPTGILNIKYKINGPSLTVNTACASGLSAVVQGYKYIQEGQAEVMIVGGVEDGYNPLQINSCMRLQAMTSKEYQEEGEQSRPFDRDRSGFVFGEGAGILVIQELEHAIKRGANILGEIKGYGESSDGHHLVKPQSSGKGQVKAIQKCLSKAKINKESVTFVDCHATSTPAGDQIEANTIKNVFGSLPYVCANKSYFGHTLGAAGAIQLILALKAMNESILPKIRNLKNPEIQGINYTLENKKVEVQNFVKNSFGFGGVNVAMVVGKYKK